ncbi:protein TolR [Parachitinimonas caeni]|uniref:Protein TolR n=1 Tax=Parachitinimonas caeni TaxID=3031301 RepID=A0ABT7DRC4_9NEIS|nr:protein TolR [Parachitinimonas caeni]MDK2122519.1 protein TolR [Parachitinimonas caeni]
MARRTRRAMAQINVVPYIDVMLVLLVIFMVAAPMMQPGLVNLPSVDRADRQLSIQPLRVEIDKNGGYSLIDGAGKPQPQADIVALTAAIKVKLEGQADRPVVIAADKAVRYEAVVKTMDALKRQQVQRVGLVVQPGK